MTSPHLPVTELGTALATSPAAHARLFSEGSDLLPLWIAEPYVPLAPAIVEAVRTRATEPWLGYEERSEAPSQT